MRLYLYIICIVYIPVNILHNLDVMVPIKNFNHK